MPLTEREQGFNEALDVAYKFFSDKSEAYYAVLRVLISDSTEAKLISERAFQLREWANHMYDLKKLSAEEIAERARLDELDPTKDR